jgi:hypothetical protein
VKYFSTATFALIGSMLLLAGGQTAQAENNWLRQDSAKSRKHYRAVQHQELPPGNPFQDDPEPKSAPKKKKAKSTEEVKFYDDEPESFEAMDEYAAASGQCPMRVMRQGTFFGGAEYLLTRPTFSEAISHVEFSLNGADRIDNRVEYNFGFQSSTRAFIGYEMCDCGGAILFTYTNLTGASQMNCGPATATSNCAGHLVIFTDTTGETLTSYADIELNVYDLDFAKTIPLASCGGCNSCDSCGGDGCSDCGPCCPLWDITLYGGVRLVDYTLNYGSQVFDASSAPAEYGDIHTTFKGAGPRIGAQIRRYFGPCANMALYARGNISLLLGDYDTVSTRVTSNTQVQQAFLTRTIPVTEIEVGGTWNIWDGAFVSAGYMFQAWHDLGMSQTIGGNLPSYDDANILSFDGMFVRGEYRF